MRTTKELLNNLIKSQQETAEIWHNNNSQYSIGRYEQALETLKFLENYHNYI